MLASQLKRFIAFLALALAAAGPAFAAPTTPIGQWFCTVLTPEFSFEAAVQSFAMEKLGPPREKRTRDGDRVNVDWIAEGLDYTLKFNYAYRESDVDRKYGFDLTIRAKTGDSNLKWLREFGELRTIQFGYAVGAGAPMGSGDPPFNFEDWGEGHMRAEWFYERDIQRAAGLCAGAKPVSADFKPPSPTDGPAIDKRTDPISRWYCSVLRRGFDPRAAIASFPLEKLPAPVEKRETDDGTTSVDLRADGEDFSVVYSYQFNLDDVNDPYGFTLSIEPQRLGLEAFEASMAWLRGFGAPTKSLTGYAVTAGPKVAGLGGAAPFSFTVFDHIGVRHAEWFSPADIKYAAELCN
jgi:hypothetical protein